jgi:aminoacrylate hydrolase
MPWCDVGRGRLAASVFGDPSSPAVLLIAGGGGAMWSWARLLPKVWPIEVAPVESMSALSSLATRFRVAVFDQAGVGQSADVAPATSADEAASDALCVGRSLLGEKFAIVGMSLGGAAATRAALQAPAVVQHLVLVCTYASLSSFVAPPPAEQTSDDASDIAVQVRRSLQPWFVESHPQLVDSTIAASRALRLHPDLGQSSIEVFLSHDGHELGDIQARTAIVCGVEDDVFPMANSELIHAALPNSQLVRVPNVGHAMHLEAPASIHEALSVIFDG